MRFVLSFLASPLLALVLLTACSDDKPSAANPSPPPTEVTGTAQPLPSTTAAEDPTASATLSSEPMRTPSVMAPDGSIAAHVEFPSYGCAAGCYVVFTTPQGEEKLRVSFDQPAMARMVGAWAVHTVDGWLDDSSAIVLGGSCECDGNADRPVLLVTRDGEVVDHGVSAWMGWSSPHLAPGGRYLFSPRPVESWALDDYGCQLVGSADAVDLSTGAVAVTVGGAGSAVLEFKWLDARNLAYSTRALPDPDAGTCSQQAAAWREIPVEWRILTIP